MSDSEKNISKAKWASIISAVIVLVKTIVDIIFN